MNNNNDNVNQLVNRPPHLAPSSYWFSFYDDDYPTGNRIFYSRLFSGRCRANNKNGNRCNKRCVIGIEFCHNHMPSVLHLQIRPSEYGLGLFAYNPNAGDNDVVFKKDQKIVNYEGEFLTNDELNTRYDFNNAPYGMTVNHQRNIDSALHRGVGSMINHGNAQQNNVRFVKDNARQRVILKATKTIRNNQQLYANYGNLYEFHDDHRTRKYKTLY
jgi:hypothetical protein